MRPFQQLMPYSEALARALSVCGSLGSERVLLCEAFGRVLAADIRCPRDLPPAARAAMDGYAVRASGMRDVLRLAGHSHLGEPFRNPLPLGSCVEIATGALLPKGADAVVMVEETVREGRTVRFRAGARRGQNVSPPGEDFRAGQVLARAGGVLHPGILMALAASGHAKVEVLRRPRVAHATGGDEVVMPGERLKGPDGVFNANAFTVEALVRAHGGEPVPLGIVPDTVAALRRAVRRAGGADLTVFSGGTSVGPKDFTLDVLGKGSRLLFRGVAVKPGRPTILGRLPGGRLFLGLPGFPVSCLMMGYAFLVPMLRRMGGLPEAWGRLERLPLAEPLSPTGRLHTFVTVKAAKGRAVPCYRKSSTTRSFSDADGFVERPAGSPALRKGAVVSVRFL